MDYEWLLGGTIGFGILARVIYILISLHLIKKLEETHKQHRKVSI